MANGLVAPFPAPAAGSVRAAIDAVIRTKENLEKAEVDLGQQRALKFRDKVDAFLAATKNSVAPADALKTRLDLDALRKTFDDQEGAIKFWQVLIDERFAALAGKFGPEVISALNDHLKVLKDRQAKEQGDVNHLKLLIAEFKAWLKSVEKDQTAHAAASEATQQTESEASTPGSPAAATETRSPALKSGASTKARKKKNLARSRV